MDKVSPGTRVMGRRRRGGGSKRPSRAPTKTTYLCVVGMERESSTADAARFSPAEEEAFRRLSRRPDVNDVLHRYITPSILGSYPVEIKRAILCLLFRGSCKRLPDGMRLRGDIKVLLLRGPSTAKLQFLSNLPNSNQL